MVTDVGGSGTEGKGQCALLGSVQLCHRHIVGVVCKVGTIVGDALVVVEHTGFCGIQQQVSLIVGDLVKFVTKVDLQLTEVGEAVGANTGASHHVFIIGNIQVVTLISTTAGVVHGLVSEGQDLGLGTAKDAGTQIAVAQRQGVLLPASAGVRCGLGEPDAVLILGCVVHIPIAHNGLIGLVHSPGLLPGFLGHILPVEIRQLGLLLQIAADGLAEDVAAVSLNIGSAVNGGVGVGLILGVGVVFLHDVGQKGVLVVFAGSKVGVLGVAPILTGLVGIAVNAQCNTVGLNQSSHYFVTGEGAIIIHTGNIGTEGHSVDIHCDAVEGDAAFLSNLQVAVLGASCVGRHCLHSTGDSAGDLTVVAVSNGEVVGLAIHHIQGAACDGYIGNIKAVQIQIGGLVDGNVAGVGQQLDSTAIEVSQRIFHSCVTNVAVDGCNLGVGDTFSLGVGQSHSVALADVQGAGEGCECTAGDLGNRLACNLGGQKNDVAAGAAQNLCVGVVKLISNVSRNIYIADGKTVLLNHQFSAVQQSQLAGGFADGDVGSRCVFAGQTGCKFHFSFAGPGIRHGQPSGSFNVDRRQTCRAVQGQSTLFQVVAVVDNSIFDSDLAVFLVNAGKCCSLSSFNNSVVTTQQIYSAGADDTALCGVAAVGYIALAQNIQRRAVCNHHRSVVGNAVTVQMQTDIGAFAQIQEVFGCLIVHIASQIEVLMAAIGIGADVAVAIQSGPGDNLVTNCAVAQVVAAQPQIHNINDAESAAFADESLAVHNQTANVVAGGTAVEDVNIFFEHISQVSNLSCAGPSLVYTDRTGVGSVDSTHGDVVVEVNMSLIQGHKAIDMGVAVETGLGHHGGVGAVADNQGLVGIGGKGTTVDVQLSGRQIGVAVAVNQAAVSAVRAGRGKVFHIAVAHNIQYSFYCPHAAGDLDRLAVQVQTNLVVLLCVQKLGALGGHVIVSKVVVHMEVAFGQGADAFTVVDRLPGDDLVTSQAVAAAVVVQQKLCVVVDYQLAVLTFEHRAVGHHKGTVKATGGSAVCSGQCAVHQAYGKAYISHTCPALFRDELAGVHLEHFQICGLAQGQCAVDGLCRTGNGNVTEGGCGGCGLLIEGENAVFYSSSCYRVVTTHQVQGAAGDIKGKFPITGGRICVAGEGHITGTHNVYQAGDLNVRAGGDIVIV